MYKIVSSIIVGGLIVVNVFIFANNKDNQSSDTALIASTAYSSPSSSDTTNATSPTASESASSDEVLYGANFVPEFGQRILKMDSYPLEDMFLKTKDPYVITDGNFRFVFSSAPDKDTVKEYKDYNNFEKLEIFNKDKLVFEKILDLQPSRFNSVHKVVYAGASYYLVTMWTGGSHCCSDYYPVVMSNNNIKIGKLFESGDYDVLADGFFSWNGRVYVSLPDTRFRYFLSDFPSSEAMFYPSFHYFDSSTGNLISANSEFKTFYSTLLNYWSEQVKSLKDGNNNDEFTGYTWPPTLTAKAIYQLLLGRNRASILKDFDADFKYLEVKYGVSTFVDTSSASCCTSEIYKKLISQSALNNIKSDIIKIFEGK